MRATATSGCGSSRSTRSSLPRRAPRLHRTVRVGRGHALAPVADLAAQPAHDLPLLARDVALLAGIGDDVVELLAVALVPDVVPMPAARRPADLRARLVRPDARAAAHLDHALDPARAP